MAGIFLSLNQIRKSYRLGPVEVNILKGVDLKVEKGELVSIMGTSGSGKSTLMNIMGFLDTPDSGSYLLEGKDVSGLDDGALSMIRNNRIGFVFQQFNLIHRLSAVDNVALPLLYRGIRDRDRMRRSHEILEKVGMSERASHRPGELSGGQQQRVAIARALVGKPSIILADEPTGALDTQVGQEIIDLFIRLNSEEGITIVIITHDPGVAEQCATQVRIEDGIIRTLKEAA
jgi:putative ABC transport system ATP-binding protein